MISGLGISSGIASAVRTAGKARATMDTMSRQIATGQRVASVKDDGAAWARASGIRAEVRAREAVSTSISNGRVTIQMAMAAGEDMIGVLDDFRSLGLRASDPAIAPSQRAALDADAGHVLDRYFVLNGIPAPLDTGLGLVNDDYYETSVLTGTDGQAWAAYPDFNMEAFLPVATDVSTAANAAIMAAQATSFQVGLYGWMAGQGAALSRLEREEGRNSAMVARLDVAIGSLTDADLGKASTARAQAETRQQLALATVRQALDAYGTYAGGLLGNVQRTQRAIA